MGFGTGCAGSEPRRDLQALNLRSGPRVLWEIAPLDAGRRHRSRGFLLRSKGIFGKAGLQVGAATGKTDRYQRQYRDMRSTTRAKQLDGTGHGYSLVRNKILF